MTHSSNGDDSTLDERIDAIDTRWSLIRAAHLNGNPASATDARRRLVLRYVAAVRRYIGAMVRSTEAADELAQDVVVRLMQGDFAGADPARGRFRDLLKTAVRNMVRSWWEKTGRRAKVETQSALIDRDDDASRESLWVQLWRTTLLDHTWERFRREDTSDGSLSFWMLRLKTDSPESSTAELVEQIQIKTGTAISSDNARQLLSRARRRFAAQLIDEVRAGMEHDTPESLHAELNTLGLLEYVREFLPVVSQPKDQ